MTPTKIQNVTSAVTQNAIRYVTHESIRHVLLNAILLRKKLVTFAALLTVGTLVAIHGFTKIATRLALLLRIPNVTSDVYLNAATSIAIHFLILRANQKGLAIPASQQNATIVANLLVNVSHQSAILNVIQSLMTLVRHVIQDTHRLATFAVIHGAARLNLIYIQKLSGYP